MMKLSDRVMEKLDKMDDKLSDIKVDIGKLTTTQEFIEEKQEKHDGKISVLEIKVNKVMWYIGLGVGAISIAGSKAWDWFIGG